jgi:hypothetical protein
MNPMMRLAAGTERPRSSTKSDFVVTNGGNVEIGNANPQYSTLVIGLNGFGSGLNDPASPLRASTDRMD